MAEQDPAEVLGVPPDAGPDQVRRAFRRLARRYHPDRNADPSALKRFLAIKAAHDRLLARIAERTAAPPPPPARPTEVWVPPELLEPAPPTFGELARPALYLLGAFVWLTAMCGFFTFLRAWGDYRPPPAEVAPERPPWPARPE